MFSVWILRAPVSFFFFVAMLINSFHDVFLRIR
jgi:hypothetical protein